MIRRPQLSDWGSDPAYSAGQAAVNALKPPKPPAAIARPAPANTPVNNNWGSAPTWSPANSYVAPVQNYTPTFSPPANAQYPGTMGIYNPGTTDWGSAGGGTAGGGSTGGSTAPVEPPPPPPPPTGGRVWYSKLSKAQQAAEDAKYLAGDSDYTDQMGQYVKALKDYTTRIGGRKKQFKEDADLATGNTNKNKTLTLNSLGEDFGARGLIDSGMFDTESNRTSDRFTDALKSIITAKLRNDSDADSELADYSSENTVGRTNARRSALQRFIQKQDLIDTSALL